MDLLFNEANLLLFQASLRFVPRRQRSINALALVSRFAAV